MSDDEQSRIESEIRKASLPNCVTDFRTHFDSDSTGQVAVFVEVDFLDTAVPRDKFPSVALDIERQIRDAVEHSGTALWPHVRFRRVPAGNGAAAGGAS